MSHHSLNKFEAQLQELFDEVDDYLEEKYGGAYPLHPARPPRGKTSSKSHDGLFNVGASFSAGYHSEHGRGYVIDVDVVTLAHVSKDREEQILEDAVDKVRQLLPKYFPDRNLEVRRDRRVFKITGDLSLGNV
ncbi:MAG: hypothetical protein ACOCRY_02925 [Alkalispirochaetaceae bacterium]